MASFSELIAQDKPTLVDVYAEWCGPCKSMAPMLAQAKNKLGGRVTVLKIDIDKNESFAAKYGIRSVPTLMLFKNNEMVWRQSGVVPTQQLVNICEQHI